ncbi:integrase, catalytic region, zinc finger, CCHC-type containing protein [Tanacetum coccineum]
MSQDVMLCVMNSTAVFGDSVNVKMQSSESCDKCFDLDPELLKKQNAYNELLKKYFENNDLKAQLQAKDTTIRKLKEHIKSMRENDKEEKIKQDMDEIETINIELEHSIKKARALSKEQCDSLIAQLNSKSMENADLKDQIQEKVFVTTSLQNELRRLKGKNVLDNATIITNATTIAPEMFKLDLDPLAPRLLKNRDAHIDYLKYTQEQADILRRIVEQAEAKQPLDNALDFAGKHAKRIQELLVYVQDTCPNANKPSEKLVAVTPLNKVKKVRFSEPLTSSSNIHKQVESSKTPDSNIHVLPSTGLKCSSSANRSQHTGNKKNDRISQTPSSNMKNKVEVQLRRANLSSNKKNRIKDPICDANVKHTMLNANSELIYVKCKQCMFDANHDVCFLSFVIDVNVRPKSKFTSANLVPLKETTSHSVETQKPEIKVYCRKPKQVKSVGSSKNYEIIESRIANNSKPNHSWGSNATVVPSSSSLVNDRLSRLFSGTVRFENDQIAKIMGYGDYQLGNVTISRLAKDGLARGITKLKFKKDHLCSACALGKSKKSSHQPKAEDTNQEKLHLPHMDLCGSMCVESINGKKYILTLREFYENIGISHQTSVARTSQQNGIVERRNWTLVEAARTMLIFSKAPLFLWVDRLLQSMFDEYFNLPLSVISPIQVAATPRAVDIADSPVSTLIDHQLRERRLMRSLEKFVGGRDYEEDLRLLQRTI